MGFPINLVEDNSLKVTDEGFEVKVRLLWYRSLPLSCVEKVALAVDGIEIAPDDIRFSVNDSKYQLDELEELVDQVWFVQDSAALIVKKPGMVSQGQTYNIEAEIVMRAPYIKVGPDVFLKIPNKYAVDQVAA